MAGDPAENHKDISRNAARLHGWSVEKWIEYIKRNPECTLPGGVAGALVRYMITPPKEGEQYVVFSTDMLIFDKWTKDPLFVKMEKVDEHVVELTFKRPSPMDYVKVKDTPSEYECSSCHTHVSQAHHDKYPLCLRCWAKTRDT